MRKVHGEVVGLALDSTDDHQRFAEVTLGMSRGMGQGYEHLSDPTSALPDVVLDDRVLAREPVLVPVVKFSNPIQHREEASTVYVARNT